MLSFLFPIVLSCAAVTAIDDLTVLPAGEAEHAPGAMMDAYLRALCHERLDQRAEDYEKLKTSEEIAAYQERTRAFFIEQLGGLPDRTPLNARVVCEIQEDGYRVQKIVYESRPKFYVTALLYLPDAVPPYPGVLVPCGHTRNGKAGYQEVSIPLALNGMAALCYDPIDQGERKQVLKEDGEAAFWGVRAHTMVGVSSILVGQNTASYRIWDGIRGLDYLASRPEVDPERLGCMGNSGGGTLTSYIMALDPRVKCAAPSCFLTSYGRLIDTIGPDDSEQQIFGQIAYGMDESDYVLLRAPKPTLMCTATRDFFDITGSWQTFREAKRMYTRLGFSERVDLAEADEKHGFSILLRTAAVRWMRRWLMGIDDAVEEPPLTVREEEELWCTPEGRVYLLDDARTSYEINANLDQAYAVKRQTLWEGAPGDALAQVRTLAGIRPLADLPAPEVEEKGTLARSGYVIHRLVLRPEPGIALPALCFEPSQGTGDPVLYVHGDGKHGEAGPGGAIEALVKAGHTVLAVDLRGLGETYPAKGHKGLDSHFGKDWQEYYLAYLMGRSFVGMRAEDTLVCARYLSELKKAEKVWLVAVGVAVPPALHAAALEPAGFASLRIERGLDSWSRVVAARETRDQLINTVHGALTVYDLPDLVGSLPKGFVTVVDPMDAMGQPIK